MVKHIKKGFMAAILNLFERIVANGEVWAAPEPLACHARRNFGKGKHRR